MQINLHVIVTRATIHSKGKDIHSKKPTKTTVLTQIFRLRWCLAELQPHSASQQAQVQQEKMFEPLQGQKTAAIYGCLYHPGYRGRG